MKIIKSANRIECKCGCIYEYEKDDMDKIFVIVAGMILIWVPIVCSMRWK